MMDPDMYEDYPGLEELIAFHGHLCPGLAIGYRATLAALEHLGIDRARDEELIAIVENDSCSVDAVQFLAGTTFGKGNLIFRDFGKQVFTFARRDDRSAVRISRKPEMPKAPACSPRRSRVRRRSNIYSIPSWKICSRSRMSRWSCRLRLQIRRSVLCGKCGEPVMETRTVERDGEIICLDCLGALE